VSADDQQDRSWQALVLEIPGHLDGDITAALGEQALGSESRPTAEGLSRVVIYLHPGTSSAEAVGTAEEILHAHGVKRAGCSIRIENVRDDHWVERYQASLRPFRIGEAFEVHPAGEAHVTADLLPLVLVPGRAFGTGEHPTTALCVEMLERSVKRGSRWLDLGCGSAILAMVTHHCGAGRTVAIDNDPEAVAVAEEVLRANGLSGSIEVRLGSLEDCGPGRFDGVVANISAFYSAATAERIHGCLRPGGSLIASGFTPGEAAEVLEHLVRAGLRPAGQDERDGWAAILATKQEEAR
jgi:ribosomal protein L11 methyltransferase